LTDKFVKNLQVQTPKPPPPLDVALTLAKETKAFAVRRDGERVLINYLYADPEAFARPEARELRGIVYREDTGVVLSRPFHKFFNYREPPHGLGEKALRGKRVYLARKEDGYLLQVWREGESLKWASRHSLEPPLVGALAKDLWAEAHERAARELLTEPLTLLFEVIDPRAPVLVRYERPALFLIAARRIETGEYLLPGVDFSWPLEHVVWDEVESFDPEALRGSLKEAQGVEGYVAYLPEGGEFVKFKTGWAFRVANFLLRPEERFMEAYTQGSLDDLLAALAGREDLQGAVLKAMSFLSGLLGEATGVGKALQGLPRKEAWLRVQEEARRWDGFDGAFARAAMQAYEGRDPRIEYLTELRKGKYVEPLKARNFFPKVGQDILG
jgi:RNA ligase